MTESKPYRTKAHDHMTKRDLLRYVLCRLIGHRPTPDSAYWYCRRCGDTLPLGNQRRQP